MQVDRTHSFSLQERFSLGFTHGSIHRQIQRDHERTRQKRLEKYHHEELFRQFVENAKSNPESFRLNCAIISIVLSFFSQLGAQTQTKEAI